MPTLTLPEAELHYEVAGEGPPVLFLHGLGAHGGSWRDQVASFAAQYRVITLDLRGSGRSRDTRRPTGPFAMAQFAADAHALLAHLGAAPAHVVGLSLGGMVAFQLAVDTPAAVASLTIVNSGPSVVPTTWLERAALRWRRVVTGLFGPARFAHVLAPRLFPRPEHAALRAEFIAMIGANDPRAYVATLDAILGWTVEDRIGAITVPTLVVCAGNDYTPVARKEAYARRLRDARLVVVPDTHHALPMEAPERFDAVLAPFLASVRGAP